MAELFVVSESETSHCDSKLVNSFPNVIFRFTDCSKGFLIIPTDL